MSGVKYHPEIALTLDPGEIFWGGRESSVRTLLGSCVSITLWHPVRRLGGICHYILPASDDHKTALNARYADGAVALLLAKIQQSGTRPCDYQGKMFGGGNMFPAQLHSHGNVGKKNINAGKLLLNQVGICLVAEDVGGNAYRSIVFNIGSGDVWVRCQPLPDMARNIQGKITL